MDKVFVIGLSKTGTTSLHAALERLGYRSIHNPEAMLRVDGEALAVVTDFARSYDALSDLPIAAFYRELDAAFPGSRFILTTRDEDSWVASCRNHFDPAVFRPNALIRKLVERVYGTPVFDDAKFREALRRHDREARAYFASRPRDFCEIDIAAPEKWAPLTAFLGIAPPDEPYPHENRASRVPAPLKKVVRWARKGLRGT